MGMYTEVYVNVDLVSWVPDSVLSVLRHLCADKGTAHFSAAGRRLFRNYSYHTPRTQVASLTQDPFTKAWSFLGKGDLKNEGEIQSFFDWISPWVVGEPGDFIGYHRYEECQIPTLVLIPESAAP